MVVLAHEQEGRTGCTAGTLHCRTLHGWHATRHHRLLHYSATRTSLLAYSTRTGEPLATAVTRLPSASVSPIRGGVSGVLVRRTECVVADARHCGGGVTVKRPLGGKGRGTVMGSRRPSGSSIVNASPALRPAGALTSIGAGAPGPCHRHAKRPRLGKGVGQRSSTTLSSGQTHRNFWPSLTLGGTCTTS